MKPEARRRAELRDESLIYNLPDMRLLFRKFSVQRKHVLFSLIALLLLGPLLVTGRLNIGDALAQNLTGGGSAASAPSNIRGTRHNLSSSAVSRQTTSGNTTTTEGIVQAGAGTGPGTSNNEVCVYCHTPHGASTEPGTPLWNRTLSGQNYTPYSSSSLQASDIDVTAAALAAPSKLCLSCHDGTLALGQVANAPGTGVGSAITLSNTAAGGTMPFGRGQGNADHGFTRRLGTDLRNDHPISFTYDSGLAAADGELRTPAGTSAGPDGRPLIGNRVAGAPKPHFPLTDNKVQCTTCHDPHKQTQKFLNTNRLVRVAPDATQPSYNDWSFRPNDDQICMGCHTRLGKAWAVSAHSLSTVANETYFAGDAAMRDFPTGTSVWQAGCLNCHDTHTAGGSRRLLREGVSGAITTISNLGYTATIRQGTGSGDDYSATSALENTCYQCHGNTPVITPTTLSATEGVPNIEAEFARTYHMPITNDEQGTSGIGNTSEVHDITDKDKMESQTQLGFFAPENRHVECTDCHNPHRVVKADTFLGGNLAGGDTTRRTHVLSRGTTGNQGNIASGALRGIWGVEPSYTATGQTTVTNTTVWKSASELPTFTVKKGDPGSASTLPVGTSGTNAVSYLTREYQLCFKCHSNYANGPLATDFPELKPTIGRGGTASATNRMTRYTNVAAEFAVKATDPPSTGTHQGEAGGDASLTPVGASWDTASGSASTVNHRSWHPVVFPTGRNRAERRMGATGTINMRPPWDAKMGTQTMHCSDCHGHSASYTQGSGPILTQVQGPHGSDKPFLLKGDWDLTVQLPSPASTSLCGKCHNPGANGTASGFGGDHVPDDKMGGEPCMYCHIAVPHGWKNKAFLANLRCVGQEVEGSTGDCQSRGNGTYGSTTIIPYYISTRLRITTWVASGGWNSAACGGSAMEDSCPRTGG